MDLGQPERPASLRLTGLNLLSNLSQTEHVRFFAQLPHIPHRSQQPKRIAGPHTPVGHLHYLKQSHILNPISAYLKAILRLLQRAPTAAEHRCRSREAHLWSCSISCDSTINCDRANAISDAAVQTSSPFSPRIPIHRVARKEAATFMSLYTA